MPTDSAERKTYPLYTGLVDYFPRALAELAHHSWANNEKHNPGEPLHWSREKSNDHEDCLMRHAFEKDWLAAAWRALALAELELEADEMRAGSKLEAGEQKDPALDITTVYENPAVFPKGTFRGKLHVYDEMAYGAQLVFVPRMESQAPEDRIVPLRCAVNTSALWQSWNVTPGMFEWVEAGEVTA